MDDHVIHSGFSFLGGGVWVDLKNQVTIPDQEFYKKITYV